jgi:hypothetical protein
MDEEYWVGALSTTILSCSIECVPGSNRGRLTSRRVTQLVGLAPSKRAVTAEPGSLKRAAIEAEERASRPEKRLRIDRSMRPPFKTIPNVIREGFAKLDKAYVKGNQAIRDHYVVAMQCLEECLEDFRCDVMLMLALTLASSSTTPHIRSDKRQFEAGPKKDSMMFAANLVTRMLWFLKPDRFPWKEDRGGVLRISEMTKKIGE